MTERIGVGRRVRRLLLWGVALSLIPVAIWATLPSWLPPLVQHLARTQGVTVTVLTVSRPGWHEWFIERAVLSLPAGGEAHRIVLRDLALRYHAADLLQGRLDAVQVGALTLRMGPFAADAGDDTVAFPVAVLFPSVWWGRLPADDISVRQWEVRGLPEMVGVAGNTLSGELLKDGQVLSFTADSGDDRLRLRLTPDDRIDLDLEYRGLSAELRSSHRDGSLRVSGGINVSPDASIWMLLPVDALGASEPALEAGFDGLVGLPVTLRANAPFDHLSVSGQGRVDFTAAGSLRPELHLPFELAWQRGQQRVLLGESAKVSALVSGELLFPGVEPLRGPVHLVLTVPRPAAFIFDAGEAQLRQVEGTVRFDLAQPGAGLRSALTVENTHLLTDRFSADWRSEGRSDGDPAARLPRARWDLTGRALAGRDGVAMSLHAGSLLHLPTSSAGGVAWDDTWLRLESDTAVAQDARGITVESGALTAGPLTIRGPWGVLRIAEPRLHSDRLRCDRSGCEGQQRLHLDGIALQAAGSDWPTMDLDIDFDVSRAAAAFKGRLETPGFDNGLEVDGRFAFGDRSGSGRFTARLADLTALRVPLLEQLADRSLAITTGRVEISGEAGVNAGKARLSGELALRDFSGTVRGVSLTGLNLTAPFRWLEGQWQGAPELTLGKADVGFAITDLHLDAAARGTASGLGSAELTRLRAQLLGGTVTAEPFVLDGTLSGSGRVRVNGLNLGALIETFEYDGLELEGALDAELPFRLKEGDLFLERGRAFSPGPGVIRLNAGPALAAGAVRGSQLDVLFGALRNFRYERLESEVSYDPDGTAILEALVEGNNPDWNQGQPVKLSLTIEENIHALVKSLRTAQVLTRNIEQSIERSMENQ